jgi:hypothetical protein
MQFTDDVQTKARKADKLKNLRHDHAANLNEIHESIHEIEEEERKV